ncbi:MAG: hypothetical protein K2X43_03045 [Hyphomonadaceae bacterium]|jgi:hypothetical protein|nr:hypothetical protein [Hyphomonadaceae bacterium]
MVFPARADESGLVALTRMASIGSGSETLSVQIGLPARAPEVEVDLKVLLAQSGPPAKTDAVAGDDTILVALALSVPQSVEDDIAVQYGLELLERTELSGLGLRIVHFRVSGNRPIGPILAELRNDQRIRRAQHNAHYALPHQGTAISRLNGAPPALPAKPGATEPRIDRKAPPAAKVAQKPAERTSLAAATSADQRPRLGRVGDVLSGGL